MPVRKNLPRERAEAVAMAAAVLLLLLVVVVVATVVGAGGADFCVELELRRGDGKGNEFEDVMFCFSDGGVVVGEVGAVVGRRSAEVLEMVLAESIDGRGVSRLAVEDFEASWWDDKADTAGG